MWGEWGDWWGGWGGVGGGRVGVGESRIADRFAVDAWV